MRSKILTVVCGDPPKDIAQTHGLYANWFEEVLQRRVHQTTWRPQREPTEPSIDDYAGILITGSPASLTAPEPWMTQTADFLRRASQRPKPILGICFGHQLIGHAFGIPTIAAPVREFGCSQVILTDAGIADPLFSGLPTTLHTHQLHYDELDWAAASQTDGATILARSDTTPVQALAIGHWIRSVQFHPEISLDIMRSYQAPIREEPACNDAAKVCSNWLDAWVAKR